MINLYCILDLYMLLGHIQVLFQNFQGRFLSMQIVWYKIVHIQKLRLLVLTTARPKIQAFSKPQKGKGTQTLSLLIFFDVSSYFLFAKEHKHISAPQLPRRWEAMSFNSCVLP